MKHTPSHYRRVLLAVWLERFKGHDIAVYTGECRTLGPLYEVHFDGDQLAIEMHGGEIWTGGRDDFTVELLEENVTKLFTEWLDDPDLSPMPGGRQVAEAA